MNRTLSAGALALGLCALPCIAASVPVRDMSAMSLAAEYYGAVYGHYALYDFDSSALSAHFFRMHYSPAPWLRLTGGVGGSGAYASPSIKGTESGLALTGGAGFYTPKLFRLLSLTAGYDCTYMTADEKGAAKKGSTTAVLHSPGAGVVFHLGRFADCEIGGLYHYFNIVKKDRTVTSAIDGGNGAAITVTEYKTTDKGGAVMDQARLYASASLHERESGAYIASGLSYALTNAVDNDNTILPNFSVWWQAGLIMRDTRYSRRGGSGRGQGGAAAELNARAERMAEALNLSAERGERRRGGRPRSGEKEEPQGAAAKASGDGAAGIETPGAEESAATAAEK